MQVIARMNVGGTARYVGRIAQTLPERGFDMVLVTGQVQGSEVEDPIVDCLTIQRVEHLGRRIHPLDDVRARHELRKAIRLHNPDLIHTHTFKAGALARSLNLDIPVVHTFHGHLFDDPDFSGRKARMIRLIERHLAPRTTRIVTVGEVVGQDLLQRGIGTPDQYISIPPGVDALELPTQYDARQQLGIPTDSLVVAWVARVTEVKGPERLITLAERFPDTTFLMAGGGNLLEDMRRRAPANLRVLGWMPTADVYAAADIALSTSFNEGMPVSLIEAQLAGLPVVANDVGSVCEVVQNEVTGFVGTNSDLADNLDALIRSDSLRTSMGSLARDRARENFSPARMLGAHANLYSVLTHK
ncbi:glycosyltransferase family 4 protein [bacterium]|nr:glycosyltransferase family 4 protein [bacterium]